MTSLVRIDQAEIITRHGEQVAVSEASTVDLSEFRATRLAEAKQFLADLEAEIDAELIARMERDQRFTLHYDDEGLTVVAKSVAPRITGYRAEQLRARLEQLAKLGKISPERVDEVCPIATKTYVNPRMSDLRKLAEKSPEAEVREAILAVEPGIVDPPRRITVEQA